MKPKTCLRLKTLVKSRQTCEALELRHSFLDKTASFSQNLPGLSR
ncbi:MAG TPA: hypothetical protein VHH88_12595 [Verrucomicrobiae bacterium]|nr:hypothetical protein [Verrucomicrobiae bacterium]